MADQFTRTIWYATSNSITGQDECMDGVENTYEAGVEYMGVAYDWGGYMTPETYSEGIDTGLRVGSCDDTSCSKSGVLECTVGVDCSGYVSIIWEAGHNSTRSIPDITEAITKEEIKKGDVMNKPGSHVVMYAYTDKSTGLPYIMEAAASAGKTVFRRVGFWPSEYGYEPRRYNEIEDDADIVGSIDNPIVIDSFPLEIQSNTRNVVSHKIDTYSTHPEIKEFGPEIIYQFELTSSGEFTAIVNDFEDDTINNDIHLLSSLELDEDGMAIDTIIRDDSTFTLNLEAGVYYLVIDSYTSDIDHPGLYTVNADFIADETPSSGCSITFCN